MKRKDILGIKDLSKSEVNEILSTANAMRETIDRNERSTVLRGRTVATLFYENSTRTRNSFESAAKNLGATTMSISVAASSVQKGESLVDTGKTLDALKNGRDYHTSLGCGQSQTACGKRKSLGHQRGRRYERTPVAGVFWTRSPRNASSAVLREKR